MTNKEFKERAVRHGEVVLIPIDKLPEDLKQIETGRQVIVGHSESGHNHVAVCDTESLALFRPKGADSPDLFLEVLHESRIEHRKTFDRHETKVLKPGLFRIYIKAGYNYFLKRMEKVVD